MDLNSECPACAAHKSIPLRGQFGGLVRAAKCPRGHESSRTNIRRHLVLEIGETRQCPCSKRLNPPHADTRKLYETVGIATPKECRPTRPKMFRESFDGSGWSDNRPRVHVGTPRWQVYFLLRDHAFSPACFHGHTGHGACLYAARLRLNQPHPDPQGTDALGSLVYLTFQLSPD